jgi:hypothetical protein
MAFDNIEAFLARCQTGPDRPKRPRPLGLGTSAAAQLGGVLGDRSRGEGGPGRCEK